MQLVSIHRHNLTGQQTKLIGATTLVQGEEENTQAQAERHECTNHRVRVTRLRAQKGNQQSRGNRTNHGAGHHVIAEQQGKGGTSERHFRDAVHRKGVVAHHHENTDETADKAQNNASKNRVLQHLQQLTVAVKDEDTGEQIILRDGNRSQSREESKNGHRVVPPGRCRVRCGSERPDFR